ncbi:putative aminopyrimidine aminohydrolase [Helianthus annuus]|uniref:Aminopyrimidine aminohydrolase n=1 Tax=Helianthus annuus TaxID=4232 RepID=A0A251SE93_HELAN|nr:bifunctional TH2 protein, mitochondrial [Helianthus annuus]KAF5767566.1 putative aminopyrimidine aminohydrolase [Helianthus annuus]KAJ0463088.1 putative aminopyrimidine aminohydrolase [Helianthus annuus]KAJ0466908.1 putative aminopyrimidine aminohydrolase [Helianthus annuus]KAJ0484454.1 putative aminopyrimidine aminohydrolase [Helianthus annuus]KAJ0655010.1 putative aminopyrimidine aminohydrolase [Helianthus annuus]
MAAATTEEGTAKKFWDKFSKESILTLYTPFVVSLASGNLKVDAFGHYVAQDVQFYKCFAQAYELAEDCADDDDAKVSIVGLRKRVLKELKHHDSFVQEWGLDLSKETTPNPATTKYTNFVLATASGKVEGVKGPGELATPFEKTKVAAYTLSAIAPSMRLNVFLGKELMDFNGDQHPYKKWIDKYSSEAYQAAMLLTEDVLDKLSVSLTGEELDTMQKLYHQALKLEMEFFLSLPVDQQTVLPLSKQHVSTEHRLTIFSDFDLTCTVVDSSAILAEIAIVTARKSDQSQPGSQNQPESQSQIARMSSADLRSTCELLEKEYTEEYERCIENMLTNQKAEEFDYEGLKTALEQLSEFERRANKKVIESNVLKGLNLDDIKRAGERLILHDGCMSFFQSITNNQHLNVIVHVLSYCWCADLIRSSFSSGGIPTMNVHANEFLYENSLSTGEIIKTIETPIDKLQAFTDILKNSVESDKTNLTIYIGDSVGDLLCLLEADIGIVIASSSSLQKIATHFGVSFVPLFSALIKKQKEHVEGSAFGWKGLSGLLYTVSSWAEVHSFIIGS